MFSMGETTPTLAAPQTWLDAFERRRADIAAWRIPDLQPLWGEIESEEDQSFTNGY